MLERIRYVRKNFQEVYVRKNLRRYQKRMLEDGKNVERYVRERQKECWKIASSQSTKLRVRRVSRSHVAKS